MALRFQNSVGVASEAALDLSVVIPCHDEEASLPELVQRLGDAFPGDGDDRVEFVIVDDGSTDRTAEVLSRLSRLEPRLVPVVRPRRGGQTAALWEGLRVSRGRWIAHLDGDLQNDPADLPAMLQLAQSGYHAVFGFRAQRHDGWSRRISSRLANAIRRAWLHDHIRDIGCSTRVIRREALDRLPERRDLHRYLPALVERAGSRIVQVPARHAPRRAGRSKYTNIGRGLRGLVDLPRMARLARELTSDGGRSA